MPVYWIYLLLSIGCEVLGTTFLKISNGFTKIVPSILVGVFYILALPFWALALKRIDISVAYTVGSAIGTASIAIIGYILFKEQMTAFKITAITMIVAGIIMLNLSGVTLKN